MKNISYIYLLILLLAMIAAGWYLFNRWIKAPGTQFTLNPAPTKKDLSGLPQGIYPLEKGSKTKEVALLQMILNKMGETLQVDGIFGDRTLAALNRKTGLQKVNQTFFTNLLQGRRDELIQLARDKYKVIL